MPYTPPARSPAASRPGTPNRSRSHSYNKNQQARDTSDSGDGPRTELPHSSSSRAYLNKHRRSPSVTKQSELPTPDTSPPENMSPESDNLQREETPATNSGQSPADSPAVSIEPSPPVSSQTSSDDETSTTRGRAREVTNLAELQAAIRIIEQHRAGSPDTHTSESTKKARLTLGLPLPQIDPSNKDNRSKPVLSPRLRLSAGARKISHSRSNTDASAFFDLPRNKFDSPARSPFESEVEDDEDDELRIKPSLIRKKSGELVRPALRASSTRRRPSSMPGTPTYSKAVHFQESSLEHVRHFLQVDRPIAVSAGSSPVDPYDDEHEYPFGDDESSPRSPPFKWEVRLTNFPQVSVERETLPVRTERVYLSPDTKILKGDVVVRNLAFHKLVVARFTLDYWKTTSEVVAEYNNDVRKQQAVHGCDLFTFRIKLEDQAKLENKTMYFCVKYSVNGQDYWDNNNSVNYQVDFSKQAKTQNGNQSTQAKSSHSLDALPRSKPSAAFSSPRPRSMPSFDDFAGCINPYEFSSFPQPSALVGDSPIRFKNKPSTQGIVPDAPGRPKASVNQQAFGNRYDFGASLSAAIQAASTSIGDRGEVPSRSDVKPTSDKDTGTPPVVKVQPSPDAGKAVKGSQVGQQKIKDVPKPVALTAEKPSLQSQSYHELLDKYCFFGSAKPSAQPAKSGPVQVDGASDDLPGPENDSGKRLGSASPLSSGTHSPPVVERKSSSKISSPRSSRSSSPATVSAIDSRTASPASFRFPFYQTMQNGLFDTHTPTAIRG